METLNIGDLEDILNYYNDTSHVKEDEILWTIRSLSQKINDYKNKFKETIITNPRIFYDKLKKKMQKFMNECSKVVKQQYKKTILLFYYKKFRFEQKIEENLFLELMLLKTPSRDISGINQITLLTSPHPDGQSFSCKHDCFFCPNEPAHEGNNWTDQPRSYLYSEPAVLRANANGFDASKQTFDRLKSLLLCGHKCDKLEFILEGGTFTEYPKPYLLRFFRDFIYTCNEFYSIIKDGLDSNKLRQKLSLQEEIFINKTSNCKIIGICIETRPDAILVNDEDGEPWIKTLLSWGVTRLQLGMQHIDNKILKKINRGHTIEQVSKAIQICKDNCFKIDVHVMPDLPLSSPELDKHMFDIIYSTDLFQPDQMKIYPCEVVPWTKIKKWHDEGNYTPYGTDKSKINEVLKYAMNTCPPWIRLPRVVRDIPDQYISGGLKCGNIRQEIENHNSFQAKDIRSREIGRHPKYDLNDAEMVVREYLATNGVEYFISMETKDRKAIFGFCRLRLYDNDSKRFTPDQDTIIFKDTLRNKGLIRELHVYGSLVSILNKIVKNENHFQHSGIGKKLIQKAEEICKFYSYDGVVIISGIGVRDYYEKKLGYHLENHYMVKEFNKTKSNLIISVILFIILYIITFYIFINIFIYVSENVYKYYIYFPLAHY